MESRRVFFTAQFSYEDLTPQLGTSYFASRPLLPGANVRLGFVCSKMG